MDIAIVGAGRIAQTRHMPAIAADPAFTLMAIVDPALPDLGVPAFATVEELIARGPAVAAAALCTPPAVRPEIARTARAAGWHLLLEKPPAATLGEARFFETIAAAGGATVMATWHSRHAPMVANARAALGGRTITGGRLVWREDARRWHPGQHWLWRPGGFGVFDPTINAFSILTAIVPGDWTVRTAAFEVPDGLAAPVAARLSLGIGEATVAAELRFDDDDTPEWTIALDTDRGPVVLRDGGAALSVDGGPVRTAPEDEYGAIYRRFAALIADGASEVDLAPLRIVADAFLVAEWRTVAPFTV